MPNRDTNVSGVKRQPGILSATRDSMCWSRCLATARIDQKGDAKSDAQRYTRRKKKRQPVKTDALSFSRIRAVQSLSTECKLNHSPQGFFPERNHLSH